ncbi:hypothetical protein D3C81_1812850 [compost metagenome]
MPYLYSTIKLQFPLLTSRTAVTFRHIMEITNMLSSEIFIRLNIYIVKILFIRSNDNRRHICHISINQQWNLQTHWTDKTNRSPQL